MLDTAERTTNKVDIFWGELAPCAHLLQLYEDEQVFLDTLESYVDDGLRAGESVIVIATTSHTAQLGERLRRNGFDVKRERRNRNLVIMNAEDTLSSFIGPDGWPNDDDFYRVIRNILSVARGLDGRRVRAFGEMVAVLWDRGQNAATVRLEHLWQKLCRDEELKLFCAYPKAGFTNYALKSLQDICAAHSQVIH